MISTTSQLSCQTPYHRVEKDNAHRETINPQLAELIDQHVKLLLPEMQLVLESSIQRTLCHPLTHCCQRCNAQLERPGNVVQQHTRHTSQLGVSLSEACNTRSDTRSDTRSNKAADYNPEVAALAHMIQPIQDSLSRVEEQLAALNGKSLPSERFGAKAVAPVQQPNKSSDINQVAKSEIPQQHSKGQNDTLESDPLSDVQIDFSEDMPQVPAWSTNDLEDDDKETTPLQIIFSCFPKHRITAAMMHFCERVSAAKEPPRHGRFADVVGSSKIEVLCVCVILANAVFAAFQADWEVKNANATPGRMMKLLSLFFCGFYLFEITCKLIVHRGYFFVNKDWKWNLFDTLLVLLALNDQLTSVFLQQAGADLSFMRTFRLMKLTRVVRLFRVLKFFRELRMLMVAIGRSFTQLLWSGIMLLFILYVFGLILLQGVSGYLAEQEVDENQRATYMEYFSSTATSIMSLYMASTGGMDWGDIYAIVKPTGAFFSFAFIFYTAFFTFAVFNILTGMFVDNMISIGDGDDAYMVLQFRRAQKRRVEDLKKLFIQFDTDNSGTLTANELEAAMRSPTGQAVLETLHLDVKDATTFFKMLVSIAGSKDIDAESFIEGCLRMKGNASGVDLACLAFQTKVIHSNIQEVKKLVSTLQNAQTNPAQEHTELKRSYSGDHWAAVDWCGKTVKCGCSL